MMKPVVKQEDAIYYVDDAKMIMFIQQNSDTKWNDICDFAVEHGLVGSGGEKVMWTRNCLEKFKSANPIYKKVYNDEQRKWITAWFEAHPWMNRVMFVFDD